MENITIKSVTHCPTCGSECKVEGGTTHHYIPIKKYTEEDMGKLWQYVVDGAKSILLGNEVTIGKFEDYINSLNKQD
jgi:hypothetical protein